MRKTLLLLALGYCLSAAMFWSRQAIVAWLDWPLWLYSLVLGIPSGIGFYLLVNTTGDGASNSRAYQWLALSLAAAYALAAFGDYSPVALLSTGPILVGCASALLTKSSNQPLRLKNSRRFLLVATGSAIIGIAIAAIWQPLFPANRWILWGLGGVGLLLEAVAQIAFMANFISPKQFRQLQSAASSCFFLSCFAQSNAGSVAFNAATLLAMLAYSISDYRKQQNPPSP